MISSSGASFALSAAYDSAGGVLKTAVGLRASGALEPISPPWDEVFILVALVLCAMPSGQQLITMTELGGGDRAVLGTIIFLQYCLVPIALAATITAIVLMTAML